jgi:hypothetical protein
MNNTEILELINNFSDEKVQEIETVDKDSYPDKIIIVAISNFIKRIEFTLTDKGDFSYKFLGVKLRKL